MLVNVHVTNQYLIFSSIMLLIMHMCYTVWTSIMYHRQCYEFGKYYLCINVTFDEQIYKRWKMLLNVEKYYASWTNVSLYIWYNIKRKILSIINKYYILWININ